MDKCVKIFLFQITLFNTWSILKEHWTSITSTFLYSSIDDLKGIVGDYNYIFSRHKSKDIAKKKLFPKFQLILTQHLQVMHDYVPWYCSLTTVLNKVSDTSLFADNSYNFIRKWFLINLFGEVCFLVRGKLQIDAKTQSSKYFKSGSVPLN